jgi:hypothetical protein
MLHTLISVVEMLPQEVIHDLFLLHPLGDVKVMAVS